mmetsp:Transcript_50405/g.128358  ORF Transcript_50405/g.128358 Transcript_50405/m.128358 type:complete len:83 (+) Transcript_50405:73-321(+)
MASPAAIQEARWIEAESLLAAKQCKNPGLVELPAFENTVIVPHRDRDNKIRNLTDAPSTSIEAMRSGFVSTMDRRDVEEVSE